MKKLKLVADKFGLSLLIFKTALAASLSWMVAVNLSASRYPYFAPLAAILSVQVTIADSLQKAVQRLIGIIGGVLVSLLITHWLSISTLSIFLVIFIGMSLARGLRMNAAIISQVAVSSFLVLLSAHNQGYALSRILETLLGSAIAILVNSLIVPQRLVPTIENQILSLSEQSSKTLRGLLAPFAGGNISLHTGQEAVKPLLAATLGAQQTLQAAEQAVRYTPFLFRTKARIAGLAQAIHYLEYITVQIRGIRRGLADLYSDQRQEEAFDKALLQKALEATAVCIARYGNAVVTPTEISREQLLESRAEAAEWQNRCLSSMGQISSPVVLRDVGSILTDLNRILKEVELM